MAKERTLSIIKPDGVAKNVVGKIFTRFEDRGLKIVATRMMTLTDHQAKSFYEVHKERPFYGSLVEFMTSGPCVPVALERDNAVAGLREVMGATDVAKAAPGTVRNLYGTSIERNAIHGSDSAENAQKELAFFFSQAELIAAR